MKRKHLESSIKEVLEVNGYMFNSIKEALQSKNLPKHVFYNRLAKGMPILFAFEQEYVPPKPKAWTTREVNFLVTNAGLLSAIEMSKQLGRTPTSVRKKCNSLGISTHKTVLTKTKTLNELQLYLVRELLDLGHSKEDISTAFFPHFSSEEFNEILTKNNIKV